VEKPSGAVMPARAGRIEAEFRLRDRCSGAALAGGSSALSLLGSPRWLTTIARSGSWALSGRLTVDSGGPGASVGKRALVERFARRLRGRPEVAGGRRPWGPRPGDPEDPAPGAHDARRSGDPSWAGRNVCGEPELQDPGLVDCYRRGRCAGVGGAGCVEESRPLRVGVLVLCGGGRGAGGHDAPWHHCARYWAVVRGAETIKGRMVFVRWPVNCSSIWQIGPEPGVGQIGSRTREC